MKIGIDIDNVIANTFYDLSKRFADFMGKDIPPAEVVSAMRKHKLKMWQYWAYAWRHKLLSLVLPIERSVETIAGWHSSGHSIFLITSRIPLFGRQTREWLKKFNVPYHELHHAKEGQKHKKISQCDLFIEDNIDECEALADHCEKVLLLDYPWNQKTISRSNIIRVKNWDEIRKAGKKYG